MKKRKTFNAQHSTFNIEWNAAARLFLLGYWALNVEC